MHTYGQTDTIQSDAKDTNNYDYEIWWFVINYTLTLEYLYRLCDSWQASFVGYQDSHMQSDSLLEHQAIYIISIRKTILIHDKTVELFVHNPITLPA